MKKIIEIRTVRELWPKDEVNLEYVPISYIESCIKLSQPIKYFGGKEKDRLEFFTAYYQPDLDSHFWQTTLNDMGDGCRLLVSESFGELKEPFCNYSRKKLKEWLEVGINQHNKCLRKIEDLFWDEKEITEDFFNLP